MKNESNEKNNSLEHLPLQELVQYYLSKINDKEVMKELKWGNPLLFIAIQRLNYINSLMSKEPLRKCPECGTKTIVTDNDKCEEYCETCGLITRDNYPYQAGIKYELPYGLK